MTGASIIIGSHAQGTPWLRRLAAAMLDCAFLPSLDVAHAETMLASLAVLRDGEAAEPLSLQDDRLGFVMRAALVAAAEELLDRSDPAADGSRWHQAALALALGDALLELPDVGRSELNSLRLRHALSPTESEPPDRLAADMRHYRDESLDLLADAHLLVRLVAGAWRLANDGESALAAVAALLEQDEPGLALRMQRATVWEPPAANDRSEADLRRSIDRFRSLEAALLPMADAEGAGRALDALERLLRPWLGRAVVPLWVDGDARLTVHGSSDLAGQRLRLHGRHTLAATAAARGEPTVRPIAGSDSGVAGGLPPNGMKSAVAGKVAVFDRQCAERLGASTLLALPVGTPEPIAVLLMNADVEAEDLNLVGIHAARWLTRLAAFERQLQSAATEQDAKFTRRIREAVHEINNPLSVMQNYLHLLGTRVDDDAAAEEQVRLISDELRRATALLQTLTDEDRRDLAPVEPEACGDVNAALSDVLALAKLSLHPDAATDFRFTPGADLPALAVAGQQLHQVMLNLTRNALEAMPGGGVLDVAVDQAVNDGGRRGIEIRVSDTGAGIAPDLLGQIFESGVSAKGPGRGLGLAITSRLVHEMGGQIFCRSRLGAGTTFVVWLPAG